MPMYDRRCTDCDRTLIDCWEPINTPDFSCSLAECHPDNRCQGLMKRAWVGGQGPKAHGDEIDVYIKHALCHSDGSPRRFRSKTELRKAEQKAGVRNVVRHVGAQGSDKSKHTQRWT